MKRSKAPIIPEHAIKRRTNNMSNYSKWNAKQDPRTELHDVLGLTGAEVSINHLPAGAGVPFVHYHKKNEEIYIVLSGKGIAVLDGEKIDFEAGDVIRVAPAAKRQFSASSATPAFRSEKTLLESIPLPTQ